ncbi:DNA polymerase IV [Castellaniella defragrans 65Phen]|uniref:DNA polymerase IV n=2 Tax=Castellaniella defragrans TaxID=75697 RepID=W8X0C6_CASD6|nr:DNA polymerase IV [Castellaniella defragrans 65Phen]
MDAFYASVELLRRPDLRGQAVVIGGGGPQPMEGKYPRLGDYVGRGVITTATYEARALGVHSAMGLMKAARLAPDAVLLPVDFPAYRHYSRLFKAAVAAIAPRIEDRGIDEIYIDLTDLPQESVELARALKRAVREATGLSCSIGISPNKLLSKIASDLDKPDGITLIGPGDLERRIWPLPVSRINGIGPKATRRLRDLGIETVGQLALAAPALLQRHFGLGTAQWLLDVSHGIDDRPVVTQSEPKSLSRETTFERDLHVRRDRPLLSRIFLDLCERLAEDLARKGVRGATVGIKLRFDDFRVVTRDLTLDAAVADAGAIHRAAGQCLKRVPLERRLRLLGVRVSKLEPAGAGERPQPVQLDLY